VRVIERRIGADTHELTRSDFDGGDAGIILEVRNDVIGHFQSP
jgi:hypothetical protein